MPEPVVTLIDLEGEARERVVPVLIDAFTGVYRWHAKRTLRQVPHVRAAVADGHVVGAALLDRLLPEVGYVYYVAVQRGSRQKGVGRRLLDDALEHFRAEGVEVVYAAVRADNLPSRRLFESAGFRTVPKEEPGYREGGLGATGLRTRMWIVSGEVLLGLRLRHGAGSAPQP